MSNGPGEALLGPCDPWSFLGPWIFSSFSLAPAPRAFFFRKQGTELLMFRRLHCYLLVENTCLVASNSWGSHRAPRICTPTLACKGRLSLKMTPHRIVLVLILIIILILYTWWKWFNDQHFQIYFIIDESTLIFPIIHPGANQNFLNFRRIIWRVSRTFSRKFYETEPRKCFTRLSYNPIICRGFNNCWECTSNSKKSVDNVVKRFCIPRKVLSGW